MRTSWPDRKVFEARQHDRVRQAFDHGDPHSRFAVPRGYEAARDRRGIDGGQSGQHFGHVVRPSMRRARGVVGGRNGSWGDAGLNHGMSHGGSYNRETGVIDLGHEPPLSVDGSEAAVIDRRRVSVQWLSGTILTGLCGAALIG